MQLVSDSMSQDSVQENRTSEVNICGGLIETVATFHFEIVFAAVKPTTTDHTHIVAVHYHLEAVID